jgi:hypothetical protein
MGEYQGRVCKRDPVTPDGNGRKWKGVPLSPLLSEQIWAGALCKSQNALEVVLGVFNSGFSDNPRNGGDPGAEMRLDPLGAFGGAASRTFRGL